MMLLRAFLENLPPLTISAAVDILIVAFLVYRVLLIVHGSRAVQILSGLGLLWLLYHAAAYTRLQTVQWLLDNSLPYLVFALIIVFQSEIRRTLAGIGRNPFHLRFTSLEVRQVSEDIVMAATLFSAQRIGALMLIERNTGLRTFAESGIGMNAQLSYDLLVAIFQRSSPLHDGAVIIRKDKIAAASCFLPLSVNPNWGTKLGTRHRAAIGITEETDAVAIVVSEETGAISLAIGGSIEQDISTEQLGERLASLFQHSSIPGVVHTIGRSAAHEPERAEKVPSHGL